MGMSRNGAKNNGDSRKWPPICIQPIHWMVGTRPQLDMEMEIYVMCAHRLSYSHWLTQNGTTQQWTKIIIITATTRIETMHNFHFHIAQETFVGIAIKPNGMRITLWPRFFFKRHGQIKPYMNKNRDGKKTT